MMIQKNEFPIFYLTEDWQLHPLKVFNAIISKIINIYIGL